MPKISVDHTSSIKAPDALDKIKVFFETDHDMHRIDAKIKCDFNTDTLRGKVTGSQFKADVSISENSSGSKISVIIDLPLLLSPFRGKIEEMIKKKLAKYLA